MARAHESSGGARIAATMMYAPSLFSSLFFFSLLFGTLFRVSDGALGCGLRIWVGFCCLARLGFRAPFYGGTKKARGWGLVFRSRVRLKLD